jgi:acetyl esterase/lipase
MNNRFLLIPAVILCAITPAAFSEKPLTMNLWQGIAPGDKEGETGEEKSERREGDPVLRVENVSVPQLTIYPAPADKANGAAVLVCPGGGYSILAWEHEGTQVCEWLNANGVTAGLLKYRVPRRKGREPHEAPLQDAQRAMSVMRHNAKEWGIDPKRLGVLGFSAGGNLAARVLTSGNNKTYPTGQDGDDQSSHADFAILIYPAYLFGTDKKEAGELLPEFQVKEATGPVFFAHAQDDPILAENSIRFYDALKAAGTTAELHIYAKGGHGFGMRDRPEFSVSQWPSVCAAWMKTIGLVPQEKP